MESISHGPFLDARRGITLFRYFDHPNYSDEKQCYPKTRAYCKAPCNECSFCTNDETVSDQDVPCGYKKGGVDACCQSYDFRDGFDNDDEARMMCGTYLDARRGAVQF